ncbi:MAG: Stp1/IreP family PP2C-type Ser/Thr phosphatase [Solirubrobacteraceae bacterium]
MLRAAQTISKTDTGRQRRDNEDNAFARAPMFVVADGMGGAQAGEIASRIAVEVFEQGLPDSGSPEERLADRAREANRQIHEHSRADPERAGMGTTLTAAYLDDAQLAIAHVGDSRAYLFRDGSFSRLTRDHTLVSALVEEGKLTEAQAAEHPQRSIITRALGPEPSVEIDTWSYPARANDVLLLCSDGLTSMISDEAIAQILSATGDLERMADDLIDGANQAGGRDNITVVLARLEETETDGTADQPTVVGLSAPSGSGEGATSRTGARGASTSTGAAVAPPPRTTARVRRGELGTASATAATAHRAGPASAPPGHHARPSTASTGVRVAPPPPGRRHYSKLVAVVISIVVVLFLLGGGGWLATRQLYFVGTNSQGLVTIYRGLPYGLPAGIRLYETFYVSGAPAQTVPVDRRRQVFDHHLRSESDASALVRDLELGKLSQ